MKINRSRGVQAQYIMLTGLFVLILGVVIPSFFVNLYSGIGLSIILGSVILLSAYGIFCINTIRTNGKQSIKWLIIPIIILVTLLSGWAILKQHINNEKNRIYSAQDTINFDGLKFNISNVAFNDVDLKVDKNFLDTYPLDKVEDCNAQSKENSWSEELYMGGVAKWGRNGTSDYEVCQGINKARQDIVRYTSDNKRLNIKFNLVASEKIETDDIKIKLEPDSGRNLDEDMDWLNNGGRWVQKKATATHDGVTHDYYDQWTIFPIYNPTVKPKLGNDINIGLTRSGNIGADIRNSENTIDLSVTYKDDTRVVRITR